MRKEIAAFTESAGWTATGTAPAWRPLLFAGAALLLAACTTPGMQMNTRAAGNAHPGAAPTADVTQRADVFAIDAALVSRLVAEQTAAASAASAPELPADPAQADGEVPRYLIGAQDVLRITVWNHPELTNPSGTANELSGRVVNSDGSFFFPFVGKVPAAGRSVEELRDTLARGLSPFLKNPQIDVSVLQYRSQRAFISGEVRNPGALPITDVPLRVTDALAQAGGLTPESDLQNVTLTRDDRTIRVDVYRLYYGGDLRQNLRLRHRDVLHVPERRFNKVFVLGEINRPNSLPMPRGRLTLAEALSDSGGVNPLSAHAGQIYVIRAARSSDRPQIFHLNAATPDALVLADRFDLKARDVVFVDAVPVVRWSRVVNNVLPAADLLRETINDVAPGLPR